jgi:SAM-dependent methyltransferase
MTENAYIGDELKIFAHAVNWKHYYGCAIKGWFGQRVLEVGAGLGETTRHLCTGQHLEWLCLEPDPGFCDTIRAKASSGQIPGFCSIYNGTTEDLQGKHRYFDTILYVDVLEHIQDDCAELQRAAHLLNDQGRVIVLSPAHSFLFSAFDHQIGHYRRYDREALRAACPAELAIERMVYLDSAGMLASLANRLLLSQSKPTLRQIQFWDSVLVRISRVVDPIVFHRIGKSILAVMRKKTSGQSAAQQGG